MTNTTLFLTDLDLVRDLGFEGVRGHQLQEEVCGFVVERKDKLGLVNVPNQEKKELRRNHFSFNFATLLRYFIGRNIPIFGIYHTHLFASPNLSGSDVRVMTQTGLDMVIVSLASNEVRHYTKMQQSFPCIESTTLNLLETPYVTAN